MEGPLRAAMEYLHNAAKRIQEQVYKHCTVNRQNLHAKRFFATLVRRSRFFVRMHYETYDD